MSLLYKSLNQMMKKKTLEEALSRGEPKINHLIKQVRAQDVMFYFQDYPIIYLRNTNSNKNET